MHVTPITAHANNSQSLHNTTPLLGRGIGEVCLSPTIAVFFLLKELQKFTSKIEPVTSGSEHTARLVHVMAEACKHGRFKMKVCQHFAWKLQGQPTSPSLNVGH